MFEFMKTMVHHEPAGRVLEIGENWLKPVPLEVIQEVERLLGFAFPDQLRTFYETVGTGILGTGADGRVSYSHNRVIHPREILELLDGTCEWMMPYTKIQPHTLPFFDRDVDLFLCVHPYASNPNAVHWMWGDKICDSLVEFFQRLLVDPDWFNPPKP